MVKLSTGKNVNEKREQIGSKTEQRGIQLLTGKEEEFQFPSATIQNDF